MHHIAKVFASLLIVTIIPLPLCAELPADAPFQIVTPDTDWKLDPATKSLGPDRSVVAAIANEKNGVQVLVITGPIKPIPTALSEISAGLRDSFTNPAVKLTTDEATTFLAYKAHRFTYEIKAQDRVVYGETMVFVLDSTGWVISASAPAAQKDAAQKAFSFFQPKAAH